jgi:transaldolase
VVERCDVINLLFFVHISALTFLFFYLICPKFSCMKFFIDTANLAHIKEANDLGILDGVTTNPSLMAKEGIKGEENILKHYADICALVDGDVSAEVLSTDFKTMVEEGKKLAAIHKNIVVKVPMIKDGIKAIKWFTDNGIRTNCTLVFSAGQAILAAKAGASYVSPFIGRVDDSNWDGILLIEQINHIYSIQGFDTQILAASIRNALHIVRSAEAGAHVCTCPLDSILGLLKHPLTDIGLAKFLEDAKKM